MTSTMVVAGGVNNKMNELEHKIIELEKKLTGKDEEDEDGDDEDSGGGGGGGGGCRRHRRNNINNGTINTTNNIIKVSLGCEDMSLISKEEKKMILNTGFQSLVKLIETVHLNDRYKQFQNVSIPNLKDKYAKCYDDSVSRYVTKGKSDLIEEIISYRTSNLREIHSEYSKDTLLHNNVLKLIGKLESYRPEDEDDELYRFYKDLCQEITLLFYNKSRVFKRGG